MKYLIYVIYDKVSDEYSMPFYQKNDACAKRSFALTMNGQIRTNKALHDSDFELYRIGEFDTSRGVIEADEINFRVCIGSDTEVFEVDEPAAPQLDKAVLDKIQSDLISQSHFGKPPVGPSSKKSRSIFSLFGGK